MIRSLLVALWAAIVLSPTAATAQPTTPPVFLNEKIKLAEIAIGQRATLRFDLRPIGAQNLRVLLFRYDQEITETPVREWTIRSAVGRERLSFKDLPRSVYTMIAFACDENGQAIAERAPFVHVEYGGWRAWEEFQPPVETVTTPPPSFDEVDVSTNIRNVDVAIALNPQAVVVAPGQEMEFTAGFHNMSPEHLKWKLVGDGELKEIDNFHYLYKAPDSQIGSKMVRIEIQSLAHPEVTGGASILVTDANPENLNRPRGE